MSSINFEFQRSIPFTEFVDNGSWLQKRDPGAYLLGFILFFTGVLITQSWTVIGAGLILCLVGIWLSKIRISLYLKGLLKALPFILIIAAINLFINPAKDFSEVIFQFWIIKSYKSGCLPILIIGFEICHLFAGNQPYDCQFLDFPLYPWIGRHFITAHLVEDPNSGYDHLNRDCHPIYSTPHIDCRADRKSTGIQRSNLGYLQRKNSG